VSRLTPGADADRLTSGLVLARSTLLSLLGQAVPLPVALVAIPLLIKGVGTDRFGVLTLAWALIGYLGLLDLGIGRALTKLVAEKLGEGQERQVPVLVWTSLLLMLVLGLVGMGALLLLSPWAVHRALNIPAPLREEALGAFYLLAIAIPFVTGSAGLRGVLEARQRFDLVNAIRIPMGVYTFAAPLVVMRWSTSLVALVGALVVGRIVGWAAHLILCMRSVPGLAAAPVVSRGVVGPLVRFGSWLTVNGVVGPLMLTMDRFVIGAMVSTTAVAFYATPYEVVTKMWLFTGALSGVVFPAFATSFVRDRVRMSKLFDRAVFSLVVVLLPLSLVVVLFARNGLDLWLGQAFALESFRVAQLLAIGVFVLGVGSVPCVLLQGVGRPDLPAKLNLLELPVYLVALVWLLKGYGIAGAALVWTARGLVDVFVLFWMSRRFLVNGARTVMRAGAAAALSTCILVGATVPVATAPKTGYLVATLTLFGLGLWYRMFGPEDRAFFGRGLRVLGLWAPDAERR
jgi:O-antigen/teichoic acid export membrane protein